ncbi:MAG: hypothetical protein ACPGHU_06355 [Porticoccaceae bacterium]
MNTKRLNQRKNRFPKQRISQLGNSLAPIIIALGISAIATVGFLKQGTKLSDKNSALSSQYEVIELLDQWNTIRSTKPLNQIVRSDLPIDSLNIHGEQIRWKIVNNEHIVMYMLPSREACIQTIQIIPKTTKGINFSTNQPNPQCLGADMIIDLD